MMFVQIASMIVAGALALPQDARTPPQGGKPRTPAQGGTQTPAQPGTQPGAQGDKTRAEQARHNLSLQRSDKLIGMNIQDKGQTNLGTIDDMILLPNGQIAYAVLAGSDANNQSKLYTVPWNTLNMSPSTQAGQPGGATVPSNTGTDRALINVERDRLMAGPSFDRTNWTKTSSDAEYFSKVDAYYGGAGAARGDTIGRPADAGMKPGMAPIRGSQLRNQAVVDAQGKTIGNITQVAFDSNGSRINYVALTLTDPASGSPRTVAVPWAAIRVGGTTTDASGAENKARFMLTTPTDRLTGAPEFQTGDASWKQMSDPKWVNDLYAYYSVPPYWNTAGSADGSARTPSEPKQQR